MSFKKVDVDTSQYRYWTVDGQNEGDLCHETVTDALNSYFEGCEGHAPKMLEVAGWHLTAYAPEAGEVLDELLLNLDERYGGVDECSNTKATDVMKEAEMGFLRVIAAEWQAIGGNTRYDCDEWFIDAEAYVTTGAVDFYCES